MKKIATIKLAYNPKYFNIHDGIDQPREIWRVLQVTDSLEYAPGQCLERPVVDKLCDNTQWKVTIGEPK